MPLMGEEHVRAYRATAGREGHEWMGTHALLLTTTGRQSGERRTAPLMYAQDDDRYVVVASRGGAPRHPAWYLNLEADPHVEVQVGERVLHARARTASGDERARLWSVMTREWPAYDDYQAKTEREIPVVVLEPS
jgi:deazaflavin-dependent oxidoreductase (nitroreductase family)